MDSLSKLREFEPIADPELATVILEALPDAVIIINAEGTIVLTNRQAELFFGYHRAELLSGKVEKLLPEPLREHHVAHRETFMAEPRVRPMGIGKVLLAKHKDGREIPVEINLSPVVTTSGTYVVAVIRRARG